MTATYPAKTNWVAGDKPAAVDVDNGFALINLHRPTAKGSIFGASAADTPAELLVGTNGQYLQADSTNTAGISWVTPPAQGFVLIQEQILGASQALITFNTGLAGYKDLFVSWEARTDTAAITDTVALRINGDTAGNYDFEDIFSNGSSSTTQEVFAAISLYIGQCTGSTAGAGLSGAGEFTLYNYAGTTFNKRISGSSGYKTGVATTNLHIYTVEGFWRNSAAITSFTLQTVSGGNFIANSVFRCWGRR